MTGGGAQGRVYHRRESDTQTPEVAAQQEASGELWGYPARYYSDIPKVKAFAGPLPSGVRGIEFTTEVPPDSGGSPRQPTWSGDRDGVVPVPGKAAVKIRIVVTKNTQR